MKKMIAFLLCGVLMLFAKGAFPSEIKSFDQAIKMVVVCEKELSYLENPFQSGQDFYYTIEGDKIATSLDSIKQDQKNIKGINLYFSCETPLSYFQERIDYLGEKQMLGETEVYYGYYIYYQNFKWLDGKKINVQLVYTNQGWILGLPLILTGF